MNITSLPPSIQGPDQLQVCADEISAFAHALSQAHHRNAVGSKPLSLPPLSDPSKDIINLLPEKQQEDISALEQLAASMENSLHSLPTIHISLAAVPPTDVRKDIIEWFRSQIHPLTLLAFHVNPELAGGMVVRTVNRVYDFSFRTALLAKKDQLIGAIEHV